MRNNLLVDTNILVYAIDEGSAFFTNVNQVLFQPDVHLFTTSKNLSEFLAVTTRGNNPLLSVDEALEHVADFSIHFSILYPTVQSQVVFWDLVEKYKPTGLKIHDFEIMAIGICNGLTQIITANYKDFLPVNEIQVIPV